MITAERIKRLAPSARADLVQAIVDNWSYAETVGDITTPRRARNFLREICVETGGIKAIEENLSYTAGRIREVWPSRFRTIEAAKPYARNPKKLALKVYSGRNGNRKGTEDGWTYRGSGFMQNTGLTNFEIAGYANNPDALRTPGPGFKAAVDYWAKNRLNRLADADDRVGLRKAISNGNHNLDVSAAYDKRARKIWPDNMKAAPENGEKPAPAPAPEPPAEKPVRSFSKEEIERVQCRLRDLGYYEVGEVDGKFGRRSRDALNAFKADNDLPPVKSTAPVDNITDEALVALSAGKKRHVAESRANATEEDLKPKSTTVLMALRNKVASMFGAVISVICAAFYGIVDFFAEAYEKTEPFRNALYHIPPYVWFGLAAVIALVIWKMNDGVAKRVVDDYRKGKKL